MFFIHFLLHTFLDCFQCLHFSQCFNGHLLLFYTPELAIIYFRTSTLTDPSSYSSLRVQLTFQLLLLLEARQSLQFLSAVTLQLPLQLLPFVQLLKMRAISPPMSAAITTLFTNFSIVQLCIALFFFPTNCILAATSASFSFSIQLFQMFCVQISLRSRAEKPDLN